MLPNDKYKDGDVVRFHIEDLKDDVELRNNLDYSTVAAIVL